MGHGFAALLYKVRMGVFVAGQGPLSDQLGVKQLCNQDVGASLHVSIWPHGDLGGVLVDDLDFVAEAVFLHDANGGVRHGLKDLHGVAVIRSGARGHHGQQSGSGADVQNHGPLTPRLHAPHGRPDALVVLHIPIFVV